ncbi:CPCC family cysteine-rich protein [Megasphaera hominis]|jgi:uncharacterized Zn finger protein (UPF0148 family)|uniref:Cysteine-rich CPCC domain-containing protein n=1 Tax=Megasphaera hominis TaxID=159836 RepID=A0ABR6VKB9_9FIRM|nr:CPCC family cysteine-rich protein [Megasphaera hominis]MBC3537734.1 hypothetical protein [Megasphaera hominis]
MEKGRDEELVCPVCKQYYFEFTNDFDICPVCGWENDGVQNDMPDYKGGANKMSLNEAREAYKQGRKVE